MNLKRKEEIVRKLVKRIKRMIKKMDGETVGIGTTDDPFDMIDSKNLLSHTTYILNSKDVTEEIEDMKIRSDYIKEFTDSLEGDVDVLKNYVKANENFLQKFL